MKKTPVIPTCRHYSGSCAIPVGNLKAGLSTDKHISQGLLQREAPIGCRNDAFRFPLVYKFNMGKK